MTIQEKAHDFMKKIQTTDLMEIAAKEDIKLMDDEFDLPEGMFMGIACVSHGYRYICIQRSLDPNKRQIAIARAIALHILFLGEDNAAVPVMERETDEQQQDIAAFAAALISYSQVSA
ncbi:hypothetical protein [Paenibacillus sp. Leaf72]|uniref:hypothetical protein n=1 Tax=Paenibacillus sp. Leaf72 TaxID=1736234 RepID=UPI0006FBA52A|nr:hypothetical protein [Paenibacillus sp. Leaf72]KQN96983.1 hypothetical protein ASF12_23225 [Paenibacillus sp. Leaf72]